MLRMRETTTYGTRSSIDSSASNCFRAARRSFEDYPYPRFITPGAGPANPRFRFFFKVKGFDQQNCLFRKQSPLNLHERSLEGEFCRANPVEPFISSKEVEARVKSGKVLSGVKAYSYLAPGKEYYRAGRLTRRGRH